MTRYAKNLGVNDSLPPSGNTHASVALIFRSYAIITGAETNDSIEIKDCELIALCQNLVDCRRLRSHQLLHIEQT